jgi:hypothetical protein
MRFVTNFNDRLLSFGEDEEEATSPCINVVGVVGDEEGVTEKTKGAEFFESEETSLHLKFKMFQSTNFYSYSPCKAAANLL